MMEILLKKHFVKGLRDGIMIRLYSKDIKLRYAFIGKVFCPLCCNRLVTMEIKAVKIIFISLKFMFYIDSIYLIHRLRYLSSIL